MGHSKWNLIVGIVCMIAVVACLIWGLTPGSFAYRYSQSGNRWDIEKLEKRVDKLEKEIRTLRDMADNNKLIRQLLLGMDEGPK